MEVDKKDMEGSDKEVVVDCLLLVVTGRDMMEKLVAASGDGLDG